MCVFILPLVCSLLNVEGQHGDSLGRKNTSQLLKHDDSLYYGFFFLFTYGTITIFDISE